MRNLVNVLLLLVTAVGGLMLLHIRGDVVPLRAERAHLVTKYRYFEVENPENYYVGYIDTGYPLLFMWRCHVPPAAEYEFRTTMGDRTSSGVLDPNAFGGLQWVGFDFRDEAVTFDWKLAGEYLSGTAAEYEMGDFVKANWSRLQFEILAKNQEVLQLPQDEVLRVFSVRIPPDLAEELREQVPTAEADKMLQDPILKLSFGTSAAFTKLERGRRSRPLD